MLLYNLICGKIKVNCYSKEVFPPYTGQHFPLNEKSGDFLAIIDKVRPFRV